jgi:hypothetical protein
MSFVVRKPNAAAVILNDLGITLAGIAASEFSLRQVAPKDIQDSVDLAAAIVLGSAAGGLVVLDPRDDSTALLPADGEDARAQANDTHWGINGGRFDVVDDPGTSITDDFIIQYDSVSDSYESVDPANLISDQGDAIALIVSGMGTDGIDSTFVYDDTATILVAGQDEARYDAATNNGTFVGGDGAGGTAYVALDEITLSDGSVIRVDSVNIDDDVLTFTVLSSGLSNVTAGVALTQSSTTGTGISFTLTPEQNNISNGTIQWDVNDSFLRNTGDTLDSGTLTIASGAAVSFSSGSTITIDSAVTVATIGTPGGGFTGDTDIINKFYVDQVAAGLDWKESVRLSTTPTDGDILAASFGSGTYTAAGGPTGTGQFTLIDLSSGTGDTIDGLNFTGVSTTGLIIGDRVLIKDQTDATQNGIYFIDAGSVAASVILTRATDQDGSPANEVSGGNTTYVEDTTAINAASVNTSTAWSVAFDGTLTLNTDDMDWVQIAGPGTIVAGIGLSRAGNVIDLDVNDLVTATAVVADIIAFHDLNGSAETSGSQTRKTTFQSLFNELNVPNAVTGTGIVVKTAEGSPDTYTTRSITVNGGGNLDGLAVSNGDGVSANPVIGFDIQNLPARTTPVDSTDRVAVWRADGTDANEYYLISEIAGAVGASDSFSTWARTGNGTGASLVADSSADTVTLDGGIGIDLTFTPASDLVSFAFTDSGMADTAVEGADTVPFFDSGNSFEPEFRSWTNVISDLGILTGISASADEDLTGIDVTGTVIGLDILGLNDPDGDMAAADEFPVHDKSEDTAGSNQKMTGQNIADGVATILNIATLTFATFTAVTTPAEDQTLLAFDEDRGGGAATYSIESQTYQWSDNSIRDNDWVAIGDAVDADSGWIMPLNGTVVMATAHTENTGGGNTFEFDLHIDAVDSGAIVTLTGGADVSDSDPTLDLNFTAGQKLRVRADQTAGTGNMGDMTIAVTVRWRS